MELSVQILETQGMEAENNGKKITCFQKGHQHHPPSLHFLGFHVNFQGCQSLFLSTMCDTSMSVFSHRCSQVTKMVSGSSHVRI